MALARTALRLCTVAALQGNTIAEGRVYDSRISDFNPETFADDAKPTIIVLTDEDEGEKLSQGNGGPPFRRMVDLVFEIGIVQSEQDSDGSFIVGYPNTDARHEASLDMVEHQIARVLGYQLDTLPTEWRKISRVQKYNCHRQVLDDAGVKIACRILTWTCDVPDDQIKTYNGKDTIPVGFNVLPEPLRRVATLMPERSAGLDTCIAIARQLAPIVAPSLEDIAFHYVAQELTNMNVSADILSGLDVPTVSAAQSGGQIDFQKGITATLDKSYQVLTLDADITQITVVGWPRFGIDAKLILQIINQGSFGINGWPAGTVWVGGTPPSITQGAGKKDVVVLTTPDGGSTIFGSIVGQDYQ